MSFSYEHLPALQQQLREGSVTCQSVVEHYLQQCKEQAHLNAFIEVWDAEALQRAKELDQRLQSGGEMGSLFGMVIAVKDVIVMEGHGATASSHMLENFESLFNATCVQHVLKQLLLLQIV